MTQDRWRVGLVSAAGAVALGGAALCGLAWGGTAWGQAMTPAFAPAPAPAGMIQMAQPGADAGTTLDGLAHRTQGYVTTGISTGGGAGVSGGVTTALVPGKVNLTVGGGTGQTPVWTQGSGKKAALARYSTYYAAVDAKLADDVQVSVGVSGTNLKLPSGRALSPQW